MSTVSHAQTVCQLRVVDVPYITREMWLICLPYVRKLRRRLREITGRTGRLWENGKSTD